MVEKIIISALFSYGWCTTFSKGNIFEAIGNWAEKNLPEKIYKPLIGCAICNAFWVATLMYWSFWGDYWVHWLMIAISAVGVNAAISSLINKIEDISDAIDPPKDE